MIFIDLETTGLLKPTAADLKEQPFITEIYACKIPDGFIGNSFEEIETLVKPPIPIPVEVIEITGINNIMVENSPSFPLLYNQLCNFFLGERYVIGHNISFDLGVIWCELSRMGKEFYFPWPPNRICTVELSHQLKDKRLTLSALHEIVTGKPHGDAHRAKGDVLALIRSFKWLVDNGYYTFSS